MTLQGVTLQCVTVQGVSVEGVSLNVVAGSSKFLTSQSREHLMNFLFSSMYVCMYVCCCCFCVVVCCCCCYVV